MFKAARSAVAIPLFRALLGTLGVALTVASRLSGRFRDQITTDLVVQVGSRDGVTHHYEFRRAARSMRSRRGVAARSADVALEFDSAALGLVTLVRPDAIGRVVKLLQAGRATYSGNAAYVLWFWGLTRMVLPYGLQRRVPGAGLPGALTKPDPASKVAGRITRESVALGLDPNWARAASARAEMAMTRGSRGEDIPLW